MNKIVAALMACGSMVFISAPAQAYPKDPVRALKVVLESGRGVHFTETATRVNGAKRSVGHKRTGVFEFDDKGVKKFDITITGEGEGKKRFIAMNQASYESGDRVKKLLPKGKVWYLSRHQSFLRHSQLLGFDEQVINPAEPDTLAALLAIGKSSGNIVTGTITFRRLEEVSPWFATSEHRTWSEDTQVSYKLTLTAAGMVKRMQSSYAAIKSGWKDLEGKTFHVDTHYRRWGDTVSIAAPDRSTVTSELPFG